jgi:trigger factor
MLADVAYNYRIDMDKLKEDEKRYKEYRDNLRPRAQESLKYELLLAEIGKKEEIKVSDEEIDSEIKGYAERQKRKFEDMKKKMKDNDTLDSLRYRMRIAKTLDFVYQNAKLDQEKHLNFGAEKENA